MFLITAVSSVAFFITIPFARFNKPEYRERVDAFFKTMDTPIDFEKEVGQTNDLRQLKVIGYFTLALGLFIVLQPTVLRKFREGQWLRWQ